MSASLASETLDVVLYLKDTIHSTGRCFLCRCPDWSNVAFSKEKSRDQYLPRSARL